MEKLKRQMTPISIHRLKSKKILGLLCRFRGMKLGDYIAASFTEELSWFTRNFFQRMIWQRSSVFIWALALRGLWRRWSFTSTAWPTWYCFPSTVWQPPLFLSLSLHTLSHAHNCREMVWGFVTCGPNEALVVSGKFSFFYLLSKIQLF
jgi:hypothetical protein